MIAIPAHVQARLDARQTKAVPVIHQAADEIVDWRDGGRYKEERGVRLEFTGRWDEQGRPVFVAIPDDVYVPPARHPAPKDADREQPKQLTPTSAGRVDELGDN